MKIALIGGGSVAQTLGAALAAKGHAVRLGIRNPSAEELAKPRNMAATLGDWLAATKGDVAVTTIPEAGAFGEVIFNTTLGQGSIDALSQAGADNLKGKVVVDVANPLDFSQGMPPFLATYYAGPTSLGEQIQAAFPEAKVVKAFNTVTAAVMVNPSLITGAPDFFIAGNDAGAKDVVTVLAADFGWSSFTDLGDITGARASEAVLPIWVRLYMTTGNPFNALKVLKAA